MRCDTGTDPGHTGEIISLTWPGQALGVGRGKTGLGLSA